MSSYYGSVCFPDCSTTAPYVMFQWIQFCSYYFVTLLLDWRFALPLVDYPAVAKQLIRSLQAVLAD